MRWLTRSLASKLMLCLVGSMALLFGLLGYMNLRLQREQMQSMVFLSADRTSDIIRRSILYSMLRNQREEVFHIINTIGHEQGFTRIRIFNKEGRISYSTDPRETDQLVDKQAEACYACHAQARPLERLNRPDRMRIYRDKDGTRVLGLITPIENEPDCSNAACHAHADGNRVLGVLDTNLSLARVDKEMAAWQTKMVLYTTLSIAGVCLICAAFIWWMVEKPVRRLIEGTQRVGQGELEHTLPVHSNDELGRLAESFNEMTTLLEAAQQENLQWTNTLERRVQAKTEELERAYHHLVQSEKMASLGKLSAVVAHELNNPLAGILTYSKLVGRMIEKGLTDEKRSADARSQLQIIETESRRCGSIVKNLLTFARQAPVNPQKNDLNAVVERCVLLLSHKLGLQSVDLVRNLATDLPAIYCDGNQIQQVLLALMINAMEAMPHGGRLTVATRFDAAQRAARIKVSDEGIGIPPDLLPKIFEPFFTTKEEGKGVGLGLAVAIGIVQQHGGTIEVASRVHQGTTFTVTLPEEVHLTSPTADASLALGPGSEGEKS